MLSVGRAFREAMVLSREIKVDRVKMLTLGNEEEEMDLRDTYEVELT